MTPTVNARAAALGSLIVRRRHAPALRWWLAGLWLLVSAWACDGAAPAGDAGEARASKSAVASSQDSGEPTPSAEADHEVGGEAEGGEVALDSLGPVEQAMVEIMRFEHARILGDVDAGLPALAVHDVPDVRARAALAIGRVGVAEGLATLKVLSTDDVPDVRAQVMFAAALLAASGPAELRAEARALVLDVLQRESDAEVKRMGIWALRKMGGPDAQGIAEALRAGLLDDAPAVQAESMHSLAVLLRFSPKTPGVKGDAVLKPVRLRAGDTEGGARQQALFTLMRLGDEADASLFKQVAAVKAPEPERALAIRGLTAVKRFDVPLMRDILLPPPDSTEENPEPVDMRGDAMTQVEAIRHLKADGGEAAIVLASAVLDDRLRVLAEHGTHLSSPDFHVLLTLTDALPSFKDTARAERLLTSIWETTRTGPALTRPDNSYGEQLNVALLQCSAAKGLDALSGQLDKLKSCGAGQSKVWSAQQREVLMVEALASLKSQPAEVRALSLVTRYMDAPRRVKVAIMGAAMGLAPPPPKSAQGGAASSGQQKQTDTPGGDEGAVAAPDSKLVKALKQLGRLALGASDPVLVAYGVELLTQLKDSGSALKMRQRLAALNAGQDPGERLDEVLSLMEGLAKLEDSESAQAIGAWRTNPVPVVRRKATEHAAALGLAASAAARSTPPGPPRPELAVMEPLEVTMRTTRGNIRIKLRPDLAPATVDAFLKLVERKYYDSLKFHRVIPGFVTQGGDPRGDGSGGPGYTLPAEWSPAAYAPGVVGMAHAGKDTGGSQFFITHMAHPHLDGGYTVFGEVLEGLDVVREVQEGDLITGFEVKR